MKNRIKILITMGDPCGIGPEVLVKSLNQLRHLKDAEFLVIGDSSVLLRYGLKNSSHICVLDLNKVWPRRFTPGKPSEMSAKASFGYLEAAVSLIKKGMADCLVTAPISKEAVKKAGFRWPGHTEFLADAFGIKHVEMVFISEHLKVVLVTRHMSLQRVLETLTKEKIVACGKLVFSLLTKYFKVKNPKIAVCGLNPHAGEGGLFGKEENNYVVPAIKVLNKTGGRHFFGPLAADTIFHRAYQGEFDLVIALYHDQGLIPFKMVEFDNGVHLTAGLPFVRTSPVHGTAFDIAGTYCASEQSMLAAILLAYRLTRNSLR